MLQANTLTTRIVDHFIWKKKKKKKPKFGNEYQY